MPLVTKIKQIKKSKKELEYGINIFENLNVKKIGVQGEPGWKFTLNKIPSQDKNDPYLITLGYTGRFEMDVSNTGGDIHSMYFGSDPLNDREELDYMLIVDLIYEEWKEN